MRRKWIFGGAIFAMLTVAFIVAGQFSLSALPEPGRVETYVATKGKHFLIARVSRDISQTRLNSPAAAAEGEKLYGAECSMCHGMDGHTVTGMARAMYPRGVDLTSAEVQGYSNPELFWIVKNGIRLSGMPGFGKTESDDHIWTIVQYIRSLETVNKSSENKTPGK